MSIEASKFLIWQSIENKYEIRINLPASQNIEHLASVGGVIHHTRQ